ncbi:DUF1428 domain-containing protein [Ferrovibrio xuzhouensis]|uniref:DUF1428 domain-containing protein n=1 Tax=Ferrovibrio xuzhouensis TaxID=1576914 RepID=A0ABV7VDD7_9PROT
MSYVDGFLLAVPKKKLATYRKMAKAASRIFREHGAIDFRECAGDDLAAVHGTPFPKLLKLKRGETVVFSWIAFKSRAHRDRVNKKVMADPRIREMCGDPATMPFDMTRMGYGGFKVIVE